MHPFDDYRKTGAEYPTYKNFNFMTFNGILKL